MATGRVERRLTAILAADVAGYSRLMGEGGRKALRGRGAGRDGRPQCGNTNGQRVEFQVGVSPGDVMAEGDDG